ncbi:hypothetical protein YC2023_073139 [Brassica napus]
MDPSLVFDKAFEEAETSRGLNSTQAPPNHPAEPSSVLPLRWCRPPRNWLKCNVSASWGSHNRMGGAAWIVRDAGGIPLSHSRRAFFGHTSNIEAELQSLLWSIRALIDLTIKWVIIESSLTQVREALLKPHEYPEWRHLIDTISVLLNEFDGVSLEHVVASRNRIANSIALTPTGVFLILIFFPFIFSSILCLEVCVAFGGTLYYYSLHH